MKSVSSCALLLGLLLLAACGGGEGGGDLTGEVVVPEGYARYEGSGVSFVHPAGWEVEERTGADGAPTVTITAPGQTETPGALVQLTVVRDGGERFDGFVEQRRVVAEQVNGGEVEDGGEVELAGATKALRTTTTTPAGEGSDPVEVASAAVEVLSEAGDILVLTAAAPEREGTGLDVDAVVDSFRLVERA